MQILVTARNMDLTGSLKEYAEKKLSALERYFPHIQEIDISLHFENAKQEGKRQVANVTVFAHGSVLRGSKASEDMYASIDLVYDKMEKQILKFKDKSKKRKKPRRATKIKETQAYFSVLGYSEEPEYDADSNQDSTETESIGNHKVIRTPQSFNLKPMFLEEAVDQMHEMSQEFFVFTNAENQSLNILYRRADGNIGLIEPEA